jgi:Flp pilus assembly pilin Flp
MVEVTDMEQLDLTDADGEVVDVADTTSRRARRERGASLVEYSLLVALIALVCIGAMMMLGGETSNGPRGVNRSASLIVSAG